MTIKQINKTIKKVLLRPSVCLCSSAFSTRASHGGEAGLGWLLSSGWPADDPDRAELQLWLKGHFSGEDSGWVLYESTKCLFHYSLTATPQHRADNWELTTVFVQQVFAVTFLLPAIVVQMDSWVITFAWSRGYYLTSVCPLLSHWLPFCLIKGSFCYIDNDWASHQKRRVCFWTPSLWMMFTFTVLQLCTKWLSTLSLLGFYTSRQKWYVVYQVWDNSNFTRPT